MSLDKRGTNNEGKKAGSGISSKNRQQRSQAAGLQGEPQGMSQADIESGQWQPQKRWRRRPRTSPSQLRLWQQPLLTKGS